MTMLVPERDANSREEDVLNGRLLALMLRRGVSKARLADEIGVSPSGVSRRLKGNTEWTLNEMRVAARLLGTSVAFLLGEVDYDGVLVMQETPAADATGVSGEWRAPRDSNPRPSGLESAIAIVDDDLVWDLSAFQVLWEASAVIERHLMELTSRPQAKGQ